MALQLFSVFFALPLVLCVPYQNTPQEGQRIPLKLNQRSYRQSNPFPQDVFDPTFVVGGFLDFLKSLFKLSVS